MWHKWAFAVVVVVLLLLNWWFGLLRKGFDSIVQPKNNDSATSVFRLFVAGLVVLLAVLGLALYLDAWKGSDNSLTLGTFGDFVGGVVNPVLTFLTFMGLLITIILQQRGLTEARAGASESTFFEMLSLHNSIVHAMDVQRRNQDALHGRDCFRHFVKVMREAYEKSTKPTELERVIEGHEVLWEQFYGDLAHYYRYLYNVIRFIDENMDDKNKVRYIRILRAQLNDDEMVVLFYNGLTDRARKFKVYIEAFSLFDNLPKERLFKLEHKDFYNPRAFEEAWS